MRKMKELSLIQNRKGVSKFNTLIITGFTALILIVIVFSVWASIVPEAQKAGDSMNDSNRCSDVGCFYNNSILTATSASPACRTNSSPDPAVNIEGDNSSACASGDPSIPLASIFGGRGIAILLIMLIALFIAIKTVLKPGKK